MTSINEPVVGGPKTEQQKAARSNLMGLLDQSEEIKGIMTENMEKVIERGEKLEQLGKTAESMSDEAKALANSAAKAQKKKK